MLRFQSLKVCFIPSFKLTFILKPLTFLFLSLISDLKSMVHSFLSLDMEQKMLAALFFTKKGTEDDQLVLCINLLSLYESLMIFFSWSNLCNIRLIKYYLGRNISNTQTWQQAAAFEK